jgi:hypothetical protein
MSERDRFDDELSRLVRSVEGAIPADLEARVLAATVRSGSGPTLVSRRPFSWVQGLAAVAGAVAGAALLFWLMGPGTIRPSPPLISEIRTELEIPGKNIKVIFIQRPDFKLPKEDHR